MLKYHDFKNANVHWLNTKTDEEDGVRPPSHCHHLHQPTKTTYAGFLGYQI